MELHLYPFAPRVIRHPGWTVKQQLYRHAEVFEATTESLELKQTCHQ